MATGADSSQRKRILLLGGSGTIGSAVGMALAAGGHEVVCLLRRSAVSPSFPESVIVRRGEVTEAGAVLRDGIRGERFDALISCLASRTGAPADAWAVDHRAHSQALEAALTSGIGHFVQLSAICLQKPRLVFQHAKIAFERELMDSPIRWTIIRPTAYFKSISGQVDRVKAGKPFFVFGDGRSTACKPISDRDVAAYVALALEWETMWNRILPVGGPGDAVTPRQQGEMLFRLAGKPARFRSIPVAVLDAAAASLGLAGRLSSTLAEKAELARIARYYATESMLVLDPETGRYDARLTPSFGSDTLEDHYRRMLAGEATAGLGSHAVFG